MNEVPARPNAGDHNNMMASMPLSPHEHQTREDRLEDATNPNTALHARTLRHRTTTLSAFSKVWNRNNRKIFSGMRWAVCFVPRFPIMHVQPFGAGRNLRLSSHSYVVHVEVTRNYADSSLFHADSLGQIFIQVAHANLWSNSSSILSRIRETHAKRMSRFCTYS